MAEPMQETEEVQIELEGEETTTEEAVVVEETQPEETQPEVQETSEEESTEKEVADYSESVKKRINKLTYKIKEAERREQAALDYAKNVQNELNKTNENLSQKDKSLYDEYSARVASQLATAEDKYKTAYDLGDTDAMLEHQKDVAKLAVELESLNRVKPEKEQKSEATNVEDQVQQQVTQQAQTQPTPDPKAQDWAKKNDWFGTDLAMTTSAFAFHRELVESEGFDPSSDEYYQEIDKRMVESFPHKFNNGGEVSQNNIVQENVAAPSRGARGKTGKGRTVKLSPSQVAIAKRLGVPLEEYAKHIKT